MKIIILLVVSLIVFYAIMLIPARAMVKKRKYLAKDMPIGKASQRHIRQLKNLLRNAVDNEKLPQELLDYTCTLQTHKDKFCYLKVEDKYLSVKMNQKRKFEVIDTALTEKAATGIIAGELTVFVVIIAAIIAVIVVAVAWISYHNLNLKNEYGIIKIGEIYKYKFLLFLCSKTYGMYI